MIGKLCDYGLEHWVRFNRGVSCCTSGSQIDCSSCSALSGWYSYNCTSPSQGSDQMGVNKCRRFVCEALSFTHRYVPVGLLERLPTNMNERPFAFRGRDELEVRCVALSTTVDFRG
jgi:hypothetical protein